MNTKNRRRRRFPRFILLIILLIILALAITGVVRLVSGKKKDGAASGSAARESASDMSTGDISTGVPSVPEEGFAASTASASSAAGTWETAEAADPGEFGDAEIEQTAPSISEDVSGGMTSAAASAGDTGGPAETAGLEEEKPDRIETELERGREYLAGLESRTPMEMEVLIDEARVKYQELAAIREYAQKREEYRDMLQGDALWDAFSDYVFLGDSRVVGFSAFHFLPEDRVLAEQGDTINAITDRLEQVRSLSPKYIFISYGINDVGIGFWPTAEEYAQAFSDRLDTLQEALPDAEIYVNSILPAEEEAIAYGPAWANIPDYSEAVRQMCEDKGVSFIDNGGIVEKHEDLYAGDGIHLQPDFYRYWAENQLLGIYDKKHGKLTFSGNGAEK